ncbi:MAG TPA: glycosyltransferase [Vicinamibacteria bacterium]
MSFDPLAHPVALRLPRRLTPHSGWIEHIPFGMLLVDLLRPRTLVELGTYFGDSYCAFCEAVLELGLDTRCCAVDTWQGDSQTGFYGPRVLAELGAHHDPLYGRFSRLVQSTFDAALPQFEDGSIDLLHIDGYHTYEAVRHDFEAWLPKVSARGVVLLHDIAVTEGDFGVHRLWGELKRRWPHFEFAHGHGLGLLAVGAERPAALGPLLEAAPEEADRIRGLFTQLGRRLTLQLENEDLRRRLAEAARKPPVEPESSKQEREWLRQELATRHEELHQIRLTMGFRVLERYRRLVHSSSALSLAHHVAGWPLRALARSRQRARSGAGGSVPKVLLVRAPQADHTARALDAVRTRYPDHEVSLVVTQAEQAAFGSRPGLARVYVYAGHLYRPLRAALELLRELRRETFDVVVVPWQPGQHGVHANLSVVLSALARARARVLLGPEMEPRPLRRRTLAAPLLDLAAFQALAPLARLLTRIALPVTRRLPPPRPPAEPPGGTLAFLLPILPDLSHTFIYREVLQMLARIGRQRRVLVVALEEGSYRPLHPEAKALLAHTVFVPTPSLLRYLATYVYYLVTRPRRTAGLVRLFAPHAGGDPSLFLRLGSLHGLHPSRGLALARLLQREGVGYVHSYGTSYPATRALVASRLLGVPFSISTFVDFDYDYGFKCLAEKMAESRFMVACTGYCKERLVALTSPPSADKVHVIHHSLDLRYHRPPAGAGPVEPDAPVDVFAACRLVPKKGLEYLLRACALLRDRGLEVRCRIMGDGEEGPRLKALAAELGVSDRVWFAGPVPNDQIWSLVGPHDVCVVPSVYCGDGDRDGIPVILLEALSQGHAVVTTPVSGIPELIQDGVNGLMVPERDVEALADAIERLVKDPALRAELARAGGERVRRHFNVEDKAATLLSLIQPAPGAGAAAVRVEAPGAAPAGEKPLVSVLLVNHNGARFVAPLFDSLARQTYGPLEVILFDNASTDDSVRLVEERYPWVRVVKKDHNTGFSRPVNEGIRLSSGPYVIALNLDVVLTETFVEELVSVLDHDPAVGWVAGKVLKLKESGPTDDIDCLGHHMSRNRYARERDYSRPFEWADYAESRFVFGASACAALYRRSMLEDVRLDGEYFDEDFFAYFEDVDLDWRAQQRGWKCVFTPRALAYHMRGGSGLIRQRRIAAGYLANRWLMLVKNDDTRHVLQDIRPVVGQLARDVGSWGRRDPLVIPAAVGRFLGKVPRMVAKRRAIRTRRVVPRAYLRGLIR